MSFEALLSPEPSAAIARNPLAQQLWRAGCARAELFERTDAVRLVDAQRDHLEGVYVERFGDWATLGIEDAAWLERRHELAQAVMALGARGVYLKVRARADLRRLDQGELAPAKPIAGTPAPDEFYVREGGAKLLVRLGDGLSTGLFLDQRGNRLWLQEGARGARVLNLFCYTCSFSVAAGLGGAQQVTSVDLSGALLKRGSANLRLNGLPDNAHRLLRADAVKWLQRATRRSERYDYIVLDPPSFSSKGKGNFSVARDYGMVARDAIALLAPGGRLLAVTNYRQWSMVEFKQVLTQAAHESGAAIRSLVAGEGTLDCGPLRAGLEADTKSLVLTLPHRG